MSKPASVEPGQVWVLNYHKGPRTYVVVEEDGVKWKIFSLDFGIFGWESGDYMLHSNNWKIIQ